MSRDLGGAVLCFVLMVQKHGQRLSAQVPFQALDGETRQACEESMDEACQGQFEEDDLWHTAAGSAVAVDEEVHPAAKQDPIQRMGECPAME